MEGQSHPLYSIDRDHLNRLLSVNSPNQDDLVEIARLFIRYEDFPGATDLKRDMLKVLSLWGINKEDLNQKTREIWKKGYKSVTNSDEMVGSSFDTSDDGV